MSELVECVPNFSEGRNLSVVRSIVAEISSDRSVRVLDQEMNADNNRCVITFVGEAEAVVEAALRKLDRGGGLVVSGWFNQFSVFSQRLASRALVARLAARVFKV